MKLYKFLILNLLVGGINAQKVDYNTQVINKPVVTPTNVQKPFQYIWAGTKYQLSKLVQGETFPESGMGPGIQDTFAATNVVPYGCCTGQTNNNPQSHSAAISGYALTKDNRMGAVGVFGVGACLSNSSLSTTTACFGGNFMASTFAGSAGGESLFAIESDINISTPNAKESRAFFCGGGSAFEPTGDSSCIQNFQMGPEPVSTVNVVGANVNWVSGSLFDPKWPAGKLIWINGVQKVISSVVSTSTLILSASMANTSNATMQLGTIVPYQYTVLSGNGSARYALLIGSLYVASTQFNSSPSQFMSFRYRKNSSTPKETLYYTNEDGVHVQQHDASAVSPKFLIQHGSLEVPDGYVKFGSYTWLGRPVPAIPPASMIYFNDGGCGTTLPSMGYFNGTNYVCLAQTMTDSRMVLNVPNSTPTDANIPNSVCTMWLNGTTLTFRCKDAAGTIYTKTL